MTYTYLGTRVPCYVTGVGLPLPIAFSELLMRPSACSQGSRMRPSNNAIRATIPGSNVLSAERHRVAPRQLPRRNRHLLTSSIFHAVVGAEGGAWSGLLPAVM